jgi:hypothetical protein
MGTEKISSIYISPALSDGYAVHLLTCPRRESSRYWEPWRTICHDLGSYACTTRTVSINTSNCPNGKMDPFIIFQAAVDSLMDYCGMCWKPSLFYDFIHSSHSVSSPSVQFNRWNRRSFGRNSKSLAIAAVDLWTCGWCSLIPAGT